MTRKTPCINAPVAAQAHKAPTALSTRLRLLLAAGTLTLVAACGSDGSGPQAASQATLTTNAARAEPADFPGSANAVPAQPASGSRPGQV